MWNDAHNTYLEERVLSAGPLELVHLLHERAIEAIGDARRHLGAGDIAARSREISRACDIVIELNHSLDPARGGAIAGNLARLYNYMLGRLLESNLNADDAVLAEMLGLISTLDEAWRAVSGREILPESQNAAPDVWQGDPLAEPELAVASHAWSF